MDVAKRARDRAHGVLTTDGATEKVAGDWGQGGCSGGQRGAEAHSRNICIGFAFAMFHTIVEPSTPPEKRDSARGDHARSYTSAQWPRSAQTAAHCVAGAAAPPGRGASPKAGARAARSRQSMTRVSSPAEARVMPLGQKRTTLTVCDGARGRNAVSELGTGDRCARARKARRSRGVVPWCGQ